MKPSIRIVQPVFIVDSSSAECPPRHGVGQTPTPGHYVALRRIDKGPSGFLRTLRYFGPFPTLAVARLVQISATALGIVESPALFGVEDGAAKNLSAGRPEPRRSLRYCATPTAVPVPVCGNSAGGHFPVAHRQHSESNVMLNERNQPWS
jgi:hypothetical protein